MFTDANTIREDLMFPKVRATLYIPQASEFPWGGEWCISLIIFGPDFRYTPASAYVYSYSVQKFCQVLREAVAEMQRLEKKKPSEAVSDFVLQTGEIDKALSLHINFAGSENLKKPEEKVSLCFGISSKTQTFKRNCTTKEVQTILTELEGIWEKVAALKQS